MSFAVPGLTHCSNCRTTLKDNEFGLCNYCRKKEENMWLSCYNSDEATRLIKQDMGGLKIILKEWLEDE